MRAGSPKESGCIWEWNRLHWTIFTGNYRERRLVPSELRETPIACFGPFLFPTVKSTHDLHRFVNRVDSLMLVPYVYGLSLYCDAEELFSRMGEVDPKLGRFREVPKGTSEERSVRSPSTNRTSFRLYGAYGRRHHRIRICCK